MEFLKSKPFKVGGTILFVALFVLEFMGSFHSSAFLLSISWGMVLAVWLVVLTYLGDETPFWKMVSVLVIFSVVKFFRDGFSLGVIDYILVASILAIYVYSAIAEIIKNRKEKKEQKQIAIDIATPEYQEKLKQNILNRMFSGANVEDKDILEEWFKNDLNILTAMLSTDDVGVSLPLSKLSDRDRNFIKLFIYIQNNDLGGYSDYGSVELRVGLTLVKNGAKPDYLFSVPHGETIFIELAKDKWKYFLEAESDLNTLEHHELDTIGIFNNAIEGYKKGTLNPKGTYVIECLVGGGGWLTKAERDGMRLDELQLNDDTQSQQQQEEKEDKSTPRGSLILGKWENSESFEFDKESEHLITVAPTGAGKGQCHVIPNLRVYEGSTFCVDVKGDNYEATFYERERVNGRDRVFKFDLTDPDSPECAHYNPLDFITDDKYELEEDCRALADMLIVPDGKSDHWDKAAKDMLNAILQYVKISSVTNGDPLTMQHLCTICWDENASKVAFKEMQTFDRENLTNSGASFLSLSETAPKEYSAVKSTIKTSLESWKTARVQAMTDKTADGWDIHALKENPASIFVVVPPAKVDQYASLLRVMVGQHVQALMKEHTKPEFPFLFMLDEFPLLRHMEIIETCANVGRSYGIKLWIFAQSMSQLQQFWPHPDVLLNACKCKLFMNVNDTTTERYITGFIEKLKPNYVGEKKALIEPAELMGAKYKEKVVVIRSGLAPTRLDKAYDYQDDKLI